MLAARTWACIPFLCDHFAHTVAFSVSRSRQSLKVREHKVLGPYVDGLSQLAVTSFEVCLLPRLSSVCVQGQSRIRPVCDWTNVLRFNRAQTLLIACSRDASITTSSRWFAVWINKTLMRHFSNVGVESEDLMQFVCQALAGLSLIKFKHLHPVPLCAALPDIIPALSLPPAVAA